MLRSILGGIAGYIVLFIIIFALFSAAFLLMGPDKAFEPGNYSVSTMWIATSLILGTIAAIVAGFVASMISKGAPKVLALIILILGGITVIMMGMAPKGEQEPRVATVSNFEAMTKAQEPLWLMVISPIVSIAGVLIGGGLRKGKEG